MSLLHITVSGADHPGITATLTNLIKEHEGILKDIGQAVTHGLLSLSMVIELKDQGPLESQLLKELLFESQKMGMALSYQELPEDNSLEDKTSQKFTLNCVAKDSISAEFVYNISTLLADNKINIHKIDNVTPNNFKILEVTTSVPAQIDLIELKAKILECSIKHEVDMAFIKDNVYRRSKRLIVFDMDSTLIQAEVIDEIAKDFNIGEQVKAITEKAMNGELDFNESLKERVSLLKGFPVEKLQSILDRIPLTPGVHEFIKTVKRLGYKVAIISGGFTFFANAFKERLGIDYAFANELEIIDGKLTGKVLGTIVNAEQKETILRLIAQQESIGLEQVVAIGDGANDLPMLGAAGLGIAFHAKDIVRKKAEQQLSHGDMTSILYFLGIPGPNAL
ncbi:MAG: phosphoserine phosphatase SerB [Bacteriovoracaceae bacterium]